MEQPLCVAVIGTGSIGIRHLNALRHISGVRPIAVPKRRERLSELAQAGYTTGETVYDVAQKARARLCVVASDTGQHLDDGLTAIRNGMDALVEKPLGVNALQAKELCLAAELAGRQVFVGCVMRFSESLNTFRGFLSKIGRLHAVRIECQSYLPAWRPTRPYKDSYSARAEEGGVLRDLIHEIDYAGWLFGWPVALQARVKNLRRLGIEADEAADLIWETDKVGMVSVRLDYLSKPTRRRLTAFGELGTLEWDGVREVVTCTLEAEPVQEIVSRQTRDEMFVAQACAFIETTQGHHEDRLASGMDGIKALAVCEAAWRSTMSGREEKVEYM